ncbi:MAG: NADH-quinone oxidoreductase subunit J [Opitutaceae bacterium]|nr:NADH-quinone oxidoreductase subunit J [Opitutaceae bacterium]
MITLLIIATVTVVSAGVALLLRNLIHSALLLIGNWVGVAAFYLWAGAEFVAFAQVLVYVGAVSMIVLFAVLLTSRSPADMALAPHTRSRVLAAVVTSGAVLGVLLGAVISTPLPGTNITVPSVTVRDLGNQLGGPHAGAVLVVGVILTVALIGAVVIASTGRDDGKPDAP